MALTTHFAQVQFRLHQIVEAPEKERDDLLKKLEDFADRGIPQHQEVGHTRSNILCKMDSQKIRQQELIDQLKTQLDDLEKYAYESGENVVPQTIMMEKQKIIIDELKQKMNLNFNELELPQLSPDELRNQVDVAIGEFVSPLKMKEQLVAQLKTQVNDLERFIKFLQVEKGEKKKMLREKFLKHQNCSDIDLHNKSCNCNFRESTSAIATTTTAVKQNSDEKRRNSPPTTSSASTSFTPTNTTITNRVFQMFNKATTIFHIFALSQFDCSSQNGARNFKRNILKKTTRGNHWGDIRAKLEVDIQEILALIKVINKAVEKENQFDEEGEVDENEDEDEVFIEAKVKAAASKSRKQSRYRSNSSSSSTTATTTTVAQPYLPPAYDNTITSKSDELKSLNIELITLVRKKFAVTLQRLIQHGLRSVNEARHLVPFIGCFYNMPSSREYPARYNYNDEDSDVKDMHAWELILEYYRIKNGDYYTETPAQKLSQSFNLDIVGDGLVSNKQVSEFYLIFSRLNCINPLLWVLIIFEL